MIVYALGVLLGITNAVLLVVLMYGSYNAAPTSVIAGAALICTVIWLTVVERFFDKKPS